MQQWPVLSNKRTLLQGLTPFQKRKKEKMEQILFLLHKFCVGQTHFIMSSPCLMSKILSYQAERRTQLNDMCHITCISTPGKAEGAEVSFKELLNERLQDFINQNPEFDFENESVKVKISEGMGRG